ncbi:[protein-PII] uridylyltransferase [Neorhodopirellula pilleata]|uniref:Bifunctional uridylyltransferase/uridylyl-removing enzyme n=1 Tax=Neorhodopirellula pilleata TaxID=2714738 RepID=A0A5C6AAL6_9BACT|nr:[protein-PII] uridylyltransferase [Neorhodopirellula pilleata]TWT96358.1 Bifunctional uridylyltransferase/uridylyl-removing enzyme [Neorhodopirellula pilleata]
MARTNSLASSALRYRDQLSEGRSRIEARFRGGLPSVQTANALTDLYDQVVTDVFANSIAQAIANGVKPTHAGRLALVAHSGYGRRDLSPFSDADLMLLTPRVVASGAAPVAGTLVRDLTDANMDVGFSVRTPPEACALAWTDPKIYTSLTESRFLAGDESTFERFQEAFRTGAKRRWKSLNRKAIQVRREERRKWGETIYLLRPNVKRSRGGLRDIQLVRWLGYATHGTTDLSRLHSLGALSNEDLETLRRAHAFMLRLRHELHFRTGRAQDVLDRPTQMEIAKAWGYHGKIGVLPVEAFMQDYFEHTRGVRYVSAFFDDEHRARSKMAMLAERVLSRRIDDAIRMGPTHIWVNGSKLEQFASNLPDVLRLMQVANEHRRRIAHPTWQAIREAMSERRVKSLDPRSVNAFLALLSRPGRLASLLRRLHELRIIEQLIPAMRRCRGLLQFNAYHKYTVDAHCIRAVEAATELEDEDSAMGRRYRRMKDKTLLHLALLIHDLGKGYEEDHSEVGRRIAGEVADAFEFDPSQKETLQWLIHKHLLINEVAFRHDLNDNDVVHDFAAEVGSVGRLELLLVHTVADLIAVGPDVLTDWKMKLIEDLYLRTRRFFDTGNLPGENDPELDQHRQEIVSLIRKKGGNDSVTELVDELPLSLLRHRGSDEIAIELCEVGRWLENEQGCYCAGTVEPEGEAIRYNVVVRQGEKRIGTFARITGALYACGLTIFRANIETVGEDLLWDAFWVSDPDFVDRPPADRIEKVCTVIRKAINDPDAPLPVPRRVWKTKGNCEPASVNLLPTKIIFDNDTFDHQTILSLFTYDCPGLLSEVASVLFQHGVSIQFAKIDTHLDQIADVFYIVDSNNEPILSNEYQHELREALLAVIQKNTERRLGT